LEDIEELNIKQWTSLKDVVKKDKNLEKGKDN
jgi:hypothetical protein